MISDQDITKLKTVFATKQDLENLTNTFATKEDLKKFATKKEFQALKYEVGDLRVELGEVKDTLDEMNTTLNTKLDKFLGRIDDLDTDNAVGTVVLYRHDRHIQALADHVGFTLPEE